MLKGPQIESAGCEQNDLWQHTATGKPVTSELQLLRSACMQMVILRTKSCQHEHAMLAMPPKGPSRYQATATLSNNQTGVTVVTKFPNS